MDPATISLILSGLTTAAGMEQANKQNQMAALDKAYAPITKQKAEIPFNLGGGNVYAGARDITDVIGVRGQNKKMSNFWEEALKAYADASQPQAQAYQLEAPQLNYASPYSQNKYQLLNKPPFNS